MLKKFKIRTKKSNSKNNLFGNLKKKLKDNLLNLQTLTVKNNKNNFKNTLKIFNYRN